LGQVVQFGNYLAGIDPVTLGHQQPLNARIARASGKCYGQNAAIRHETTERYDVKCRGV
jgi:hypothetical protein